LRFFTYIRVSRPAAQTQDRYALTLFSISMSNLKYMLLILAILTVQSCISDKTNSEEVEAAEVEINEILRISNDNIQGRSDLILGAPYRTLTDHEKNIYTLDSQQNKIFKFDSTGQFINTFGQRGSGPGEFQSISGMLLTDAHQLMVLDFPSQQYTVFNADGSVAGISSLKQPYAPFKPIIISNELLLPWVENGKIIHSLELENNEITNRFIDVEDVLQTNEEYEQWLLSNNTGSLLALSNDRIVFTPTHYSGNIHVYDKIDDRWVASEQIPGHRQIDQAFTIHETTDKPHRRSQTIFPQSDSIIGFELHSWSMGLFALNNGKFAHLSLTNIGLDGDQMKLVVEIFESEEMRLERFVITDQLSITAMPEQIPVWMDRGGYLYIADMRGEPALRKLELVW
jgi:hypothetical protein